MAVLNPADLTFNGEEIKSISEAIFESGFAKPEITQFHSIVNDIVAKKQIAILGRLSGLLGKGSGGCDPASATNTVTNTEKFWDPQPVSDRITECWTNLRDTFFVWGLKQGIMKPDLTATDFALFLEELMVDAIWECVYRIAWMNAKDADEVSGGGVITNGTDLDYFNKIDGLWKQVFTIVTANANRKTAGLDVKNSAATYALQEFNDTDTTNRVVTKLLQKMRFNSDLRLRNLPTKVYVVTQSVADQYEAELIDSEKLYTTERLENGLMALKNGGITVIAFDLWDRIIREYEDNGTTWNLPHRAVLYNPDNVLIGTENASSLDELETIYDPVTKKYHIDFLFNIDAKIGLDYEIQAAY